MCRFRHDHPRPPGPQVETVEDGSLVALGVDFEKVDRAAFVARLGQEIFKPEHGHFDRFDRVTVDGRLDRKLIYHGREPRPFDAVQGDVTVRRTGTHRYGQIAWASRTKSVRELDDWLDVDSTPAP